MTHTCSREPPLAKSSSQPEVQGDPSFHSYKSASLSTEGGGGRQRQDLEEQLRPSGTHSDGYMLWSDEWGRDGALRSILGGF